MIHALAERFPFFADACWTYLVHASWQSAIVGLLILAAVAVGGRWPAPLRYGLLCVALVKFVLPPFGALTPGVFSQWNRAPATATASTSLERTRDLPPVVTATFADDAQITNDSPDELSDAAPTVNNARQTATDAAHPSVPNKAIIPVASHQRASSELKPAAARPVVVQSETLPTSSWKWTWREVAVAVWLAGTCLVATWLIDQRRRLRRVLRHGAPLENSAVADRARRLAARLGMRRIPEFRQSTAVTAVPCSCGLVAPKVILPAQLIQQLPSEQLDVVLAHELAHHRRGDVWVNALQIVAFVVFWFHPVYWMLNRSIRRVREECCDDLLIARGLISPEACCDTLLAVARSQVRSTHVAWGVSMVHPLAQRLTRLLDDSQLRRAELSRGGWMIVIVTAALFWPGLRDRSTAADKEPSVTNSKSSDEQKPVIPTAKLAIPPKAPVKRSYSVVSPGIEYSGTVTDVDGKPIAGADVQFSRYVVDVSRHVVHGCAAGPKTKTQSNGKFLIRVSYSQQGVDDRDRILQMPRLVATSPGYGAAFVDDYQLQRMPHPVLRLAKGDVPIKGRLVTPDGKPAAGVEVAVRMMQMVEKDDGTPLPLDVLSRHSKGLSKRDYQMREWLDLSGMFPTVRTDRDGRFEIHGIGRERIARLMISGPTVESRWISVATRKNDGDDRPFGGGKPSIGLSTKYGPIDMGILRYHSELRESYNGEIVLAATFEQVVDPSRPLIGVVRDGDTGQPLPEVRVASRLLSPHWEARWYLTERFDPSATTNERGEFRLTGLRKRMNSVLAEAPEELPYFNRSVTCSTDGDGTDPVRLEIKLLRGIDVSGRLLDHRGRPVEGVVSYLPLVDNHHAEKYSDALSVGGPNQARRPDYPQANAGRDGKFRIPVLPGPGILLAKTGQQGIRRSRFYDDWSPYAGDQSILVETDPTVVPTLPRPTSLTWVDAYKGIDLPADAKSANVELAANSGHVIEGKVVDAEGHPAGGVTAFGTSRDRLPDMGTFSTRGLVPGKPRLLYFLQGAKNLAGYCRVQDGDKGPVTVHLVPCGSIRGQLVDSNDKPMAATQFYVAYAEADGVPRIVFPGGLRVPTASEAARAKWMGQSGPPIVERPTQATDENGFFNVKGLIPQLPLRLVAQLPNGTEQWMTETAVVPGHTQDVGQLKLRVP